MSALCVLESESASVPIGVPIPPGVDVPGKKIGTGIPIAKGLSYELPSRWRRSSASMNASRSPSRTASTLPVS